MQLPLTVFVSMQTVMAPHFASFSFDASTEDVGYLAPNVHLEVLGGAPPRAMKRKKPRPPPTIDERVEQVMNEIDLPLSARDRIFQFQKEKKLRFLEQYKQPKHLSQTPDALHKTKSAQDYFQGSRRQGRSKSVMISGASPNRRRLRLSIGNSLKKTQR